MLSRIKQKINNQNITYQPALSQSIDYIKSTKVFRRNRKDAELKISHESVRIYLPQTQNSLKTTKKEEKETCCNR